MGTRDSAFYMSYCPSAHVLTSIASVVFVHFTQQVVNINANNTLSSSFWRARDVGIVPSIQNGQGEHFPEGNPGEKEC